MRSIPIGERVDDLAAKMSLAAFVASSEAELSDQSRNGFVVLLCDAERELREIAEEVKAMRQESASAKRGTDQ